MVVFALRTQVRPLKKQFHNLEGQNRPSLTQEVAANIHHLRLMNTQGLGPGPGVPWLRSRAGPRPSGQRPGPGAEPQGCLGACDAIFVKKIQIMTHIQKKNLQNLLTYHLLFFDNMPQKINVEEGKKKAIIIIMM